MLLTLADPPTAGHPRTTSGHTSVQTKGAKDKVSLTALRWGDVPANNLATVPDIVVVLNDKARPLWSIHDWVEGTPIA